MKSNSEPEKFEAKFEAVIPPDSKRKNLPIVLVIITVIAIGLALYFYTKYNEAKANPQEVAQAEVVALVARVGRLILLPQNETPTVATVTDPAPLSNQPFFVNAQTGDKVLIYTNARKAILYDPNQNKIIEVAPINIGPTPSSNAASAGK